MSYQNLQNLSPFELLVLFSSTLSLIYLFSLHQHSGGAILLNPGEGKIINVFVIIDLGVDIWLSLVFLTKGGLVVILFEEVIQSTSKDKKSYAAHLTCRFLYSFR